MAPQPRNERTQIVVRVLPSRPADRHGRRDVPAFSGAGKCNFLAEGRYYAPRLSLPGVLKGSDEAASSAGNQAQ